MAETIAAFIDLSKIDNKYSKRFFGENFMKKNLLIFIACVIISFGAFCDTYFMWGGDTGYENMAGNNGWYFDTFFDVQHYFF